MVEKTNWRKFRYFSKDPNTLLKEIKQELYVSMLHVYFLFGSQTLNEYSQKKRKKVEANYRQFGGDLLDDFPIIVTALPCDLNNSLLYEDIFEGVEYMLVLLDGHHRVRYGPKYGIRDFPSVILTPSQTALAYGRNNIQEMLYLINGWVDSTLTSFIRREPNLSLPKSAFFSKDGIRLISISD